MYLMKSVDDLWDHIAYVILYAPNDFPVEDFLMADQQMNLERAFNHLKQGVLIVYPEDIYEKKRQNLYKALNESYDHYKAGDVLKGATILNQFQDSIFKQS